jgi:hypothetical protein
MTCTPVNGPLWECEATSPTEPRLSGLRSRNPGGLRPGSVCTHGDGDNPYENQEGSEPTQARYPLPQEWTSQSSVQDVGQGGHRQGQRQVGPGQDRKPQKKEGSRQQDAEPDFPGRENPHPRPAQRAQAGDPDFPDGPHALRHEDVSDSGCNHGQKHQDYGPGKRVFREGEGIKHWRRSSGPSPFAGGSDAPFYRGPKISSDKGEEPRPWPQKFKLRIGDPFGPERESGSVLSREEDPGPVSCKYVSSPWPAPTGYLKSHEPGMEPCEVCLGCDCVSPCSWPSGR